MPAELVAQRGDHLGAEGLLLAGAEPRQQRQRDDRRRHVEAHRLLHGPAPLARVFAVATAGGQLDVPDDRPPLVPTSTNSIPWVLSASARRSESRKFELPPSMTMSPRVRCGTSCSMVLSTGAPAGTMTQTTRRGASCLATSARSFAVLTPF